MAASKSSKFNMLDGLSIAKTKNEEPAKEVEEVKPKKAAEAEKKEKVSVEKKEEKITEPEIKEKKERVRDATTILSLVLTPEMKSFIKFEANRKKMTMNDYVCSLIRPDYEKDKELYEEYKRFMEKFES